MLSTQKRRRSNMFRVLVMCLYVYFGTVSADYVRDQCRRMLLHSEFRRPCSDLVSPTHVYRGFCMVTTAADEQFLKDAQVRFIYQEPGVTSPKICAGIRDKKNFAECVSAPDTADDSVSWTPTDWSAVTGEIYHRQFTLSTGEFCPYEESIVFSYELSVTADNYGEAYIDGKSVTRSLEWPTVSKYNVLNDTQVLAFVTWNHGSTGPTGLRAYLSNGLKTDDTSGWVCSEQYEQNWEKVDFDDSHWSPANVDHRFSQHIIGNGAVTIGCLGRGEGAEYFRIKLN